MRLSYLVGGAIVTCALLTLGGCQKEVDRLSFAAEGTQRKTVQLAPGNVAFWTKLDIKFEGPAALAYRIELSQSGRRVATATCNPLSQLKTKMGWVQIQRYDSYSITGNAEMACEATLPTGGPTAVEATLGFATKPAMLTLTRADLVLKQ